MSSVADRAQLLLTQVPRPRVWLKWARGSASSVLDQAFISTSNFVLGIVLARWLTPAEYGGYALGFSIFLLASLFYQSVILEPMSVYGPGTFSGHFREYLGSLLRIHGVIAGIAAAVVVVVSVVLHAQGHVEFARTLLGVTVATPCVLLLWLSRRSALVEQPGFHVAAASFTYTLIVVGGSYGFHKVLPLTAATAFLWMAAGAIATSAVQLWRLRPVLNNRHTKANVSSVWSSHWGYGRWAILTALAQWACSNSYYFALTGSRGIALSGYLRALLNFALPLMQTMVALMWVVQPHAVRVLEKQGIGRLKTLVVYITLAYAGLAILYWGTILLVNHELIHLLYGGRYSELRYWLPGLALSSILQMAGQGVAVGLRAIDLPSAIFQANLCSAAVTFAIGLPSVLIFQVPGAVAGMIAANAVALIAQIVLLVRRAPATQAEVACVS